MSKSLENEYKNLCQTDMQDFDADALWARIEAALPEKEQTLPQKEQISTSVAEQQTETNAETNTGTNTETENETENSRVIDLAKKRRWYQNKRLMASAGTVAAACILGIIFLPGVLSTKEMTSSTSNNDTCTAQECAEEYVAMDSVSKPEIAGTSGSSPMQNSSDIKDHSDIESEEDAKSPCDVETDPSNTVVLENMIVRPTEWVEDHLQCEIVTPCDFLPEGTIFYIIGEDAYELVIGEEYPCTLQYLYEEEGYKYFSIR